MPHQNLKWKDHEMTMYERYKMIGVKFKMKIGAVCFAIPKSLVSSHLEKKSLTIALWLS